MKEQELAGRRAVVTGAGHGIGQAIVLALRSVGAEVFGVDKDTVDVTQEAQVNDFVARHEPIHILVNCAGGVVGQVHKPVEQVTDQEWSAIVNANLTGAFHFSRAVVPGMKRVGWGRIVTISSSAGRSVSLTGIQSYAAAKAGQIGLTRQLAHELGPFGITVNCIAPGLIVSNPATREQWDSYGEEGQQAHLARLPLRRLGSADDIAFGVSFFCSEKAGWITGQTLSIDGGQIIL